ncbi:transcription factor MYB59-like isoform X2 [Oryza glaberrima]|uniref:Uncharacterized protein n=1 Tax=Oryza barthii TaxID=65489 RepID=A0A0D3G2I9_9ORYZ|nr:transcription factor MYB59-like isoform X2 [Oryza glaberrima]
MVVKKAATMAEAEAEEEMMMRMMCGSGGNEMMKTKMKKKNREGEEEEVSGGGRMRKGPWTEQEDVQLVWFVRLFGERRWDFLAKVSGLKRTGKSCRLRWVNYLHPGLKRGRITADEERLILHLHSQWGSRWSRIARSLPGRTDNEIKNFWRTHMRKIAHHAKKKTNSPSPAPTTSSGSLSSSLTTATTTMATAAALQESSSCGGEDEAVDQLVAAATTPASQLLTMDYTMDQLWNDIAAAETDTSCYDAAAMASPPSPVWEFCTDYSLWRIDDEEYYKKMLDASQ